MGAPLTGGPGFFRNLTLKQVAQYWRKVQANINKQLRGFKTKGKGTTSGMKGRSL